MGDIVDFDANRYDKLEMLFQRYRKFVAEHGEPTCLYVVNDKRMAEMNRAAGYIKELVDNSLSEIELNMGIDEYVRTMGYIDMRTDYFPLSKSEMELLYKAEELADAADMCVTDDERVSFELAFHDIMTPKVKFERF